MHSHLTFLLRAVGETPGRDRISCSLFLASGTEPQSGRALSRLCEKCSVSLSSAHCRVSGFLFRPARRGFSRRHNSLCPINGLRLGLWSSKLRGQFPDRCTLDGSLVRSVVVPVVSGLCQGSVTPWLTCRSQSRPLPSFRNSDSGEIVEVILQMPPERTLGCIVEQVVGVPFVSPRASQSFEYTELTGRMIVVVVVRRQASASAHCRCESHRESTTTLTRRPQERSSLDFSDHGAASNHGGLCVFQRWCRSLWDCLEIYLSSLISFLQTFR